MTTESTVMEFPFSKSVVSVWTDRPRQRVRNPEAGIVEARWYEEHKVHLINNYANQWLAIVGNQIVDNAPSFDELHKRISAKAIYGAFIQFVPDTEDSGYFIA